VAHFFRTERTELAEVSVFGDAAFAASPSRRVQQTKQKPFDFLLLNFYFLLNSN
jgi:hypothetical protein